jgi:hypothetical protein
MGNCDSEQARIETMTRQDMTAFQNAISNCLRLCC